MARIVPSSLVDEITGKFNGDVFQMWRGIIVRKKGTRPRQPRTLPQTSLRQYFSYLSGDYDKLSSAFKSNWDYYASLVSSTISGFNAFMKLNQRILYANYSSLVRLYDSPPERNNPASASDFTFSYDAGLDKFKSEWSSPLLYNYYDQCFFAPVTGYRDTLFPAWSFSQTVSSHLGYSYINAVPFVSGTQLRARIRVMNCYGEISSFSSTLTATKS